MDQKNNEILEFIKSRKSIRNFASEKIQKNTILEILDCGRWAPSGLNNQPWKVCIVTHQAVKKMLSDLTKYGEIIENSYVNLVVFLDKEKGYNRVKDIQAMGAFMENLLLGAHALNLGAVWLGEILNQKEKVNEIFKFDPEKFELMGVIAIGVIDKYYEKVKGETQRKRRTVEDFIEWF